MTESVTPPDAPLVDPETGETPPLSPQRLSVTQAYDRARIITMQQFLDVGSLGRFPEWQQYEHDLAVHMESDDAP